MVWSASSQLMGWMMHRWRGNYVFIKHFARAVDSKAPWMTVSGGGRITVELFKQFSQRMWTISPSLEQKPSWTRPTRCYATVLEKLSYKKCPSLTVAVGTVVYLKNWRLTSRSLRRQWRCRSLRTPRTRIACSPRRRQRSSEAFLEDFFGLRRHAWTLCQKSESYSQESPRQQFKIWPMPTTWWRRHSNQDMLMLGLSTRSFPTRWSGSWPQFMMQVQHQKAEHTVRKAWSFYSCLTSWIWTHRSTQWMAMWWLRRDLEEWRTFYQRMVPDQNECHIQHRTLRHWRQCLVWKRHRWWHWDFQRCSPSSWSPRCRSWRLCRRKEFPTCRSTPAQTAETSTALPQVDHAALPQDRSQRVYILAHREARLAGRLRWMVLIPTQCMLADALTKPMLAVQLLKLMTSGQVDFENQPNHPIEAWRLITSLRRTWRRVTMSHGREGGSAKGTTFCWATISTFVFYVRKEIVTVGFLYGGFLFSIYGKNRGWDV